ncbi:MAG: peptidoglycan DD-metalloendopeptidase family protein, partial [Lachnospiraceae bacterium]|nr:peptidoglycan DD-metalloendopeptidase family protein [Lachnospiraceae bacterium]
MNKIFLDILNNSITACWIIAAIILVRLALKKAPKRISCLLWIIVGLRLLIPFSIESKLSVIPSATTIPADIEYSGTPEIDTGISSINNMVNPVITRHFTPAPIASANPLQILIPALSLIWLIGTGLLLIYAFISYFRLKRSVAGSAVFSAFDQKAECNSRCGFNRIFICENIETPFILGIFIPKIYLPAGLTAEENNLVLSHELSHVKRLDHLWKPLGFILLSVYWFNPLCWIAYLLLCKDIEFACDERATKNMESSIRADYCQALLNIGVERKMVAACPVAFGETSVKSRVKSILNYKKPAFWIIIACVFVVIVAAVCLMTNPPSKVSDSDLATANNITEGASGDADENLTESSASFSDNDADKLNNISDEIKEHALYSLDVDMTHDGKNDYLEVGIYYFDDEELENPLNTLNGGEGYIKIYDSHAKNELLYEGNFSQAHIGNAQYSLVFKDDLAYIMKTDFSVSQGQIGGGYEMFWVGSDKTIHMEDSKQPWVPSAPTDTYDDFESMAEEFNNAVMNVIGDNAVLLAACDVNKDPIVATNDSICRPDVYYLNVITCSDDLTLTKPLDELVISHEFSYEHTEVDFAAPTGTPVYAVFDGQVLDAGFVFDDGYNIWLISEGGILAQYKCLDEIKTEIGYTVKAGDI